MLHIYARSSTQDQDYQYQVNAMAHLMENNHKLFTDLATGRNMDRQGFNEMLISLREGDTVVVHALDRLGRNAIELSVLLKEWAAKGIGLTVVTAPEFSFEAGKKLSPMQGLLLSIMTHVAEMELSLKDERTKAGIQRAKEAGKYKGKAKDLQAHKQVRSLLEAGERVCDIMSKTGKSRSFIAKIKAELRQAIE